MSQLRALNDNLQKAAIELLGEEPARISQDLETLKTWIKQQPHLKANMDDQFLVSFLRGCKYSIERAKSKIDKFFTLRSKFPELFYVADVNSPRFREIFNLGIYLYLPTPLNDNGPRIAIYRDGLYPVDKYTPEEVASVCFTMQEILLMEDDYVNVHGLVLIGDFQKSTMGHLFQWTPAILKKWAVYTEEAIPLRPKSTHFINSPKGFDTFFNVFKPMLSEKLQKRLFVHGSNLDTLIEQIPLKYLPKEYGGENGSVAEILDEWEKKLDQYSEYFKNSTNYGTDEKLRPGKAINFESLFGMDGSFRKLNVD